MSAKCREDGPNVFVIGAGIIGLCAALYCQRKGARVHIVDALPPGSGASFGNGGLIAVGAFAPMSLPGTLRKLPRWLFDSSGPLSIDPVHALRAAPWFISWVRAGNKQQVKKASTANHSINAPALQMYKDLLGADFKNIINETGTLQVWEGTSKSPSETLIGDIREELGLRADPMSGDECRDLVPGLSQQISRGLFFPENGSTVSPGALTQALAKKFVEGGGKILHEMVLGIAPREGGGATLQTSVANHQAEKVVIAAGAQSNALLGQLKSSLPLKSERGYHLVIETDARISRPVLHQERGFGMASMVEGVRVSGTVEIAGMDKPPNPQRSAQLGELAYALFPSLKGTPGRIWMGHRPSLPKSVPVIDELPQHHGIFVAVGHGHYGMIGAPATGEMVSELVMGRPPSIPHQPFSFDAAF